MFGFNSSRQKKKIFILLGQEDKDGTFCCALADSYQKGATESGHEVRRTNIGDLKFDPFLHKGYKVIQELEPDLKKVQEDMRWAEHIVIFYPTWWSSMPALLKGFFDRVWLPGFAFHFHKGSGMGGMGWDALLRGRTGLVVTTMEEWPLAERVLFGDSTNEISRAILKFSGIKPVRVQKIGPLKDSTDTKRKSWLEWAYDLGKEAR